MSSGERIKLAALYPFYWLYKEAISYRNKKYDSDPSSVIKLPVPVISVGNITVGGTGKTVIVDFLADFLAERKIKFGIISRGYKGQVEGSAEVDLAKKDSDYFGDEPSMLSLMHPEVPIFVGKDKVATGRALLEKHPETKILIADDAFQHRRLHRDIDVVLLDATEEVQNYRPLPLGRSREPLENLSRADIVIVSKANLVKAGTLKEVISFVESCLNENVPLLLADFDIQNIKPLQNNQSKLSNYLLLSGLGNPQAFEKSVVDHLGEEPVEHIVFPDHHKYEKKDVDQLLKRLAKYKIEAVVTSQKDVIKLSRFKNLKPHLWVTQLKARLTSSDRSGVGLEHFYDKISRLLS